MLGCMGMQPGSAHEKAHPPPFVIPHPLQSPSPRGGDRHVAQKASETRGAEGAEENFSLVHTGTVVEGDRHLVTPPPQPRMGGADLTLEGGGGLQGGGVVTWALAVPAKCPQ